ncbi:hypothetical protein B5M43_011965 [Microbacterium sp. MEC084]|uniref:hypothetical protein n=1 Tax=unclassified Microbacterium TaxID=2609290 RepID=UPI0006F76667|nr:MULTISPECIES: hypothetical protein [unclassified Microbacterium]KQZ07224.1 hypothetical protein ASD19_12270 [Microbacterium sp. Root53]MCD1269540.1 hypothetical protein [Microbacterium sp. MEC084]
MWFWVTADADVRCDHKLGRVAMIAGEDFVFVGARPVVTGDEPLRRPIGGCPNVNVGIKPCTTTFDVQTGRSGFVTIAGRPVIRADLAGTTDGTPQGGVRYRVEHPGQLLVSEMP